MKRIVPLLALLALAACASEKVVRRDATVNLTGVEEPAKVMDSK